MRHAHGDWGWVKDRNATCFCLGSVINLSATALHNLASGAPGATVLRFAASPVGTTLQELARKDLRIIRVALAGRSQQPRY